MQMKSDFALQMNSDMPCLDSVQHDETVMIRLATLGLFHKKTEAHHQTDHGSVLLDYNSVF